MKNNYLHLFSFKKSLWKGVKITQSALQQIKILSSLDPTIKGLKLNIKKSGCAGFVYVMDWVKIPEKDDIQFSYKKKANVYIPTKSMPYLDGIKIDYVQDGLNKIFKFTNPKSKMICGCGESFGIDE